MRSSITRPLSRACNCVGLSQNNEILGGGHRHGEGLQNLSLFSEKHGFILMGFLLAEIVLAVRMEIDEFGLG